MDAEEFGFEFNPNTCRIHQNQKEKGWISFSLGMVRIMGKIKNLQLDELNESPHTPSLPPLKKEPNQFSCAVWWDIFVSDFKATKSLQLPSDYWYEMTECWACYHEDYTTLPGQIGGQVFAQENVLLSGISYYLLHPSHLDLGKVHVRLTGREVSLWHFYMDSRNLTSL